MTINKKLPYFPKATCVWLIEHTKLSFKQIADFCGFHELEVQAVADGEVNWGVQGADPIVNGQLTKEEITRCESNADAELKLHVSQADELLSKISKKKKASYTPVNKRQDKPNAIAWLLKTYPEIKDNQIIRLIGTTKNTINALRNKTHKNIKNIKPIDPVILGLTSQTNLNSITEHLKTAHELEALQESILNPIETETKD